MDLKLTVRGRERADDILVTYEAGATVGDIAAAVQAMRPAESPAGPVTLAVAVGREWRPVPADTAMADAAVVSGTAVTLHGPDAPARSAGAGGAAAILTVLEGPDAGLQCPLPLGETVIGRASQCDIRLGDPLVSKRHVAIRVGEEIEVVDLNSSNGVEVNGVPTARSVISALTAVTIGDTELRVVRATVPGTGAPRASAAFVRSPVLEPAFGAVREDVPRPPAQERQLAVPWLSLLVPLVLGVVLWVFSRQLMGVLFLAFSPLFLVAGVVESRTAARRAFAKASAAYRESLAELKTRGARAREAEAAARCREHPAAGDGLRAAIDRGALLWSRRPGHPRFLELRVALGTRPSRSRYALAGGAAGDDALAREVDGILAGLSTVDHVPIVAALTEIPGLGVCGGNRYDVVRGLLVQVLALHAPSEVRVVAVAPAAAAEEWSWLRWVPHTISGGLTAPPALGADSVSCELVVARIEQLVEKRRRSDTGRPAEGWPVVVVVVDDGAPVERGRLLAAVTRGEPVGVHLIWTAEHLAQLPAACQQFLDLSGPSVRYADTATGDEIPVAVAEVVTVASAEAFARQLAPLVEADGFDDGQDELPRSAMYLEQPGVRDLLNGPALAERWTENGSLRGLGPRRKPGHLRAHVGVLPRASFQLDLREHGPHALVGGTTGAGKSAFLQSWIMGLALGHSPQRVTFLLVDYKGGTAFKGCETLPHTVGLVTDLDGHLVGRALTSLKAELRYRESLLNQAGFPDLGEMERADHPLTPPSLIIVVDEFATLVKEVPDFVDGVIDVAQRGRSLGLHLILATQRPAGVIKENLRANTNLRIALRMADDEDSVDVIGSTQAARFPLGLPGRAVAKIGAGRTTVFQALFVAGHTPATPPAPRVILAPLRFGALVPWQPAEESEVRGTAEGPSDLVRLIGSVCATTTTLAIEPPRKPWLPPLPAAVDLAGLADDGTVSEHLAFGVVDLPEQQAQRTAVYVPDQDGTMLVVGTGGSGKSTVLRSLAAAAGEASIAGGAPWHVYALDFGGGGLAALADLPHVGAVVGGGDHERLVRLVGRLREILDRRAARYAGLTAGTIADYRTLANEPAEPRILLLLDNLAALRAAYENGPHVRLLDALYGIAQDGRPVGVHLVVTADRPGVAPPQLTSTVQKQVVLRLAQEHDLAMAGLRADAFGREPIPGRGYLAGREVQVAVPAGSPSLVEQTHRLQHLATQLRAQGRPVPEPIGTLPVRVALSDLPVLCDGRPALGIGDDTLDPIGFSPGEPLVLAGPPQSGRSSVLATLALSLQRARPELPMVHVGRRRSLARSMLDWTDTAAGDDEVRELALKWCERARAGETFAVVVEGIPDYLSTSAESYLQDLVNTCAQTGNCVLAEGDTSRLGSSWPLLQAVRVARHGLILQPDQTDGDLVLNTSFPRVNRAEFPPGRGLYVRSGRAVKVQVALPE